MKTCEECKGKGIVPDTESTVKDCPACNATGKVIARDSEGPAPGGGGGVGQ